MSGTLPQTRFLDTAGTGHWSDVLMHVFPRTRDYGSSVMYAEGKILVMGGSDPPTASAEVIDLNVADPAWKDVEPMHFARRQMNAAVPPDGTVFASGGTSGPRFNNSSFKVLHTEAWDPATCKWTLLAPQAEARLYHSTLVLLPDGRLLSAGGGQPFGEGESADHFTGQIFSPPYLFKGPRPTIADAPGDVTYGQSFAVKTPDAASIGRVTWVRLPSVTHSFNQNQRFNVLSSAVNGQGLDIKAPANANLASPGHYRRIRGFREFVGESLQLRGVEVTVVGVLVEVAGRPSLRMVEGDRTLPLARLEHKVQWDPKQKREQPATAEERESYQGLVDHLARENKPLAKVRIIDPLKPPDRRGGSPILSVRTFAQLEP